MEPCLHRGPAEGHRHTLLQPPQVEDLQEAIGHKHARLPVVGATAGHQRAVLFRHGRDGRGVRPHGPHNRFLPLVHHRDLSIVAADDNVRGLVATIPAATGRAHCLRAMRGVQRGEEPTAAHIDEEKLCMGTADDELLAAVPLGMAQSVLVVRHPRTRRVVQEWHRQPAPLVVRDVVFPDRDHPSLVEEEVAYCRTVCNKPRVRGYSCCSTAGPVHAAVPL
mmetsp:Transcript_88465/g.245688  ORF Transcript_88465/g.245688 Transcript_88465/m.245688 type:complete len:221 (-) Transcript_88465:674-1336(-)